MKHPNPFKSHVIEERSTVRHGWSPVCFMTILETERPHLRGGMNTPIWGAPHLSEDGEALQQSGGDGKDVRSSLQLEQPLVHWYALQTYPRHEKRVHEDLSFRAVESFLPLYETLRRWKNGCKVRVELPLFPGYIFVRIHPRERFRVLSLPGAVSLVGSASGPWPLPDSEVMNLRDSLVSRRFEPHPYLTIGQKVRITSGPLANLTGLLVRYAGGMRIVVSVDLIRQSASAEVDADDVEALGPAPADLDA
jgi:transcription antitermination factor NusG